MRQITIACVAAIFASQACFAETPTRLNLARADTSVEQFHQDRDDCIAKATTGVWGSTLTPRAAYVPNAMTSGGSTNSVWPRLPTRQQTLVYKLNPSKFLQCMQARGYQQSPVDPQAPTP